MSNKMKLACLFLWSVLILCLECKKMETILFGREFKSCDVNNSMPVKFDGRIVLLGRSRSAINATMEVTEVIPEITTMVMTTDKCRDAANINTCEVNAYKAVYENGCDLMNKTEYFWSSYMRALQPPLSCPFQKGVYKLINFEPDLNHTFKIFPLKYFEGYFWIVRFWLYYKQTPVFCSQLSFEVMSVRKS